MITEQHIESAIIGYHRNGATIQQIVFITGLSDWRIESIIEQYLKTKK